MIVEGKFIYQLVRQGSKSNKKYDDLLATFQFFFVYSKISNFTEIFQQSLIFITLLKHKMTQSPKKHIQSQYLQQLLAHHSSTASAISQIMGDKQVQYQQKIKEGQYNIRRSSFSLGIKPHLSQKNIDKLRRNRDQLSTQLQSLSSAIKNESRLHTTLTEQQRKIFVRQMIIEQKKLNQLKQQKRRAQQQRKSQQEQNNKKQQQMAANQRIQNKRKLLQRRLSQQQEQRQLRAQEFKYRNREFRQVASQKILMHRMLQNYNKLNNTNLEQKKKKLAEIRQIHKPFSKKEIQQHMSRIVQYKEQKQQQKESMGRSKISQSKVQFYKSKWYKDVARQQKIDENKLVEEQKQVSKQLKDRQKKYAEYIRQNFIPESDDNLAEDIAKRQQQPIVRLKSKQVRQMGLDNLKYSKEKIISKEQIEEKVKQESNTIDQINMKPKNYLQQLKSNRKGSSNDNFFQKMKKQPLAPQQIQSYAQALENRAKKKQQLKKIGKNISDEQLDQLYIKALEAKLNLLSKQKK